jgi:pilus assembly protein Flp/PilA
MNYVAIKMITRMKAMWATREQGATAVEYALMVALIAIAIIAAVTFLSGAISTSFNKTGNSINPPAPAGG